MRDNSSVSFDLEARRYLRNTLNEVVNGIRPTANLEARIAAVRPAASVLLQEWVRHSPDLRLSAPDARLLLETCRICNEDFEGDEFRTRLGYTRAEAEQVIGVLSELARKAVLQPHAAAS